MFSMPTTTYALCDMDGETVGKFTEYDSEAELIGTYDVKKADKKVVAIAWSEMKDDSRLIWILVENVLDEGDDPMDLLMNLYGQIFGFDDEFTAENE